MDIIHPQIEKYLELLEPHREAIFHKMEKLAEEQNFPAVGPQVGLLLHILATAMGARRVLELGSGFGYSGLWFAKALPADGELILSDFEAGNKSLAEDFFAEAGFGVPMNFLVGDALEIIDRQYGEFDIIFNDIDKELYPQTIDPVYEKLRRGGLFITDNSLWYGRVTGGNPDDTTSAVLNFNEGLSNHPGFMALQLPLRDGIALAVKV
jgi:predicted O-methyltransferase YrrM